MAEATKIAADDKFVEIEAVEESTKQQSFAKLPQCLCLHIQRTGFDSGMAYKRDDRVGKISHKKSII